MFLKSVEIFGFKSFADRTKIEFSTGISALLGPNGCGKSNVVDCIKWVLGEQATKTLRAEKMEDVIFNGTDSRKPLNVAEVSLVLSNDESILPIDMPEISVKRRLYRSGDSEYYINNTNVRLKEVRELFFDTGIGKSSYSVMEQGKIDQILSSRPEERRYIFEEAAGITKYKIRGAEAERKLQRTEENMVQVNGILREVKRSHDSLYRQSQKTEEYRLRKNTIFEIETKIQLLRLRDFMEKQNGTETELKKLSKARSMLKSSIDSSNEFLEQNMDVVNTMEEKLIEYQKKIYGIDLEKNSRESQISIIHDRRNEVAKRIEAGTKKAEAVKTKINELKHDTEEREKLVCDYDIQVSEIHKNIQSFEQHILHSEERIVRNDESIKSNEENITHLDDKSADLQNKLKKLIDDIVDLLDQNLKDYSTEKKQSFEKSIEDLLKEIKIKLSGKNRVFSDIEKLDRNISTDSEMIKSALGGMDELVNEFLSLEQAFGQYRACFPDFIDEFLSPQGIITHKRDIESTISSIRSQISALRKEITAIREENKNLSMKIVEYRQTLEELRINQAQIQTRRNSMLERLKQIRNEIIEQNTLLEQTIDEIDEDKSNSVRMEEKINELKKQKSNLEKEESELKKSLADLEKGILIKNKDLLSREKELKKQMQSLSDLQNDVEKLQIELSSISTEIRTIYDNFRDRHSRDLTEFASDIYEIKEPMQKLRDKLASEKEKLKNLGHVNLMAPEEYKEVKERFDFLNNQIRDLTDAKEDLKKITEQIRIESTDLFVRTYEKIKKNFHSMFRRLFGGGRGELRLVDSRDVLTSGIEIYAQPPGKKLENISLLSGGEKSMTAVALLFATYLVKPSPFCILDEIDAALDEANVGRFVGLLTEFGKNSQFIVITHNKKTVAGAETLLGVTMEESGISKIISIRIGEIKNEKD